METFVVWLVLPSMFKSPKNYAEFAERYPNFVSDTLEKHFGSKSEVLSMDFSDWCSEIEMHLATLPKTSKYRALGFTDRIQLYSPEKSATGGRYEVGFKHYVGRVINNRIQSILVLKQNDPMNLAVGLGAVSQFEMVGINTAQMDLNKFREALWNDQKDLLPILQTLLTFSAATKAAEHLMMSVPEFNKEKKRLLLAVELFLASTPLSEMKPRRKRYTKRSL
jgi:hypothetical protein